MDNLLKVKYVIENGKKKNNFFYGSKFPSAKPYKTALHNHGNAEIHLAFAEDVICNIDGKEYKLNANDAILIPAGVFHYIEGNNLQEHFSFHVDADVKEVIKIEIPFSLCECFKTQWKNQKSLMNYIIFICNEFFELIPYDTSPNNDYKYLIGEFFVKNYQHNVCVADLAKLLHLSEMQTQRLVKKYTGRTFGENLRTYRMTIADYLSNTTDMTLEEISRYVGYASYNGFWKAQQKHK